IFLTPRNGGEPAQLTDLDLRPGSISWSPDSKMLVFTADESWRDEHTYGKSDIWTVTVEGVVSRLTDDPYVYRNTHFSPDGRYIAFTRSMGLDMVIEQKLDHGSPSDLYIMPAGGGDIMNLTATWDLSPGSPRWSPDSRHIYFSSGTGGNTHLFRVAIDDGRVEQVTTGDRRLGSISFDSDFSSIAYTVTDPTRPAEVYTSSIDGSNERQLTFAHNELLSSVTFSGIERLLYPSRDGTPIEGWLLYPYGYSPDQGPYPMILSIHGGPHSAYGNSFSFQFQLWAAHGYFVLYTNPRGSTGYGEDFKWATWGGWGILDYEDIMAGVDYAVEHFPIDEHSLGVTGGSYGGFMTNWVIGHTDRFAAAVSKSSISNWISDYGTADIARTKESEFYGKPWEKEPAELMMKLSPITYAGNATTPTLFIHGELDVRTPITEAEQMYFALKKVGTPARFIRYPDSYHGGWTHWRNIHRYYNELEWWETYLRNNAQQ
ncbi:S9 family peptidase, partial [candidate division KSB1 bacterium]